jgi:poly(3-hydroxybutyrate) depolymerase
MSSFRGNVKAALNAAHIALHGCKQDAGDRRFVDETGYNAWADTNRLIILYPQTPSSWY